MNTIVIMFYISFEDLKASKNLTFDCNDVNLKFLRHITHENDKVFDFNVAIVNQKIYDIAMNKIVEMTIKCNVIFVCTSFD